MGERRHLQLLGNSIATELNTVAKKMGERCFCYFLSIDKKSSIGLAGRLIICTVPRDPNSIETRVIASLLGASTMLTKSYFPRTEYCWGTLAPKASISLLT